MKWISNFSRKRFTKICFSVLIFSSFLSIIIRINRSFGKFSAAYDTTKLFYLNRNLNYFYFFPGTLKKKTFPQRKQERRMQVITLTPYLSKPHSHTTHNIRAQLIQTKHCPFDCGVENSLLGCNTADAPDTIAFSFRHPTTK